MTYSFVVLVNPVGKGRPRFAKGRTYTPARTAIFEEHVATAARAAKLPVLTGPLSVRMIFRCEPQRGGPSDIDNLIKASLDGLKAHFNDRNVTHIEARRDGVAKGAGQVNVFISDEQVRTITAHEYSSAQELKHRPGWDRTA